MTLHNEEQAFTMIQQFFLNVENQYKASIFEIFADNG